MSNDGRRRANALGVWGLGVWASVLCAGGVGAQDTPDPAEGEPAAEQPVDEPGSNDPALEEDLTLPRGVPHFPLEQGRRWHYRVRFGIEAPNQTEEASESEDTEHHLQVYMAEPQIDEDGTPLAVMEWKLDDELAQRSFFRVVDGEVQCVRRIQGFAEHMKEFRFDPPMVVAADGMSPEQEWTWSGEVGSTESQQTLRVLRRETIEINEQSFDALVIELEFEGEDESRSVTRRWLAEGVGMVREVSELRTPTSVFRCEALLIRPLSGDEGE